MHRYFETSTEIVRGVVANGLPPLREAITELLEELSAPPDDQGGTREAEPPPGGV